MNNGITTLSLRLLSSAKIPTSPIRRLHYLFSRPVRKLVTAEKPVIQEYRSIGWLIGPPPPKFSNAWYIREVKIFFLLSPIWLPYLIYCDIIRIRIYSENGEFAPTISLQRPEDADCNREMEETEQLNKKAIEEIIIQTANVPEVVKPLINKNKDK